MLEKGSYNTFAGFLYILGWKVINKNDKNVNTFMYDFKTSKGVSDKSLAKMY